MQCSLFMNYTVISNEMLGGIISYANFRHVEAIFGSMTFKRLLLFALSSNFSLMDKLASVHTYNTDALFSWFVSEGERNLQQLYLRQGT